MIQLRSVELRVPDAAGAAAFLADPWGLARAQRRSDTLYLRGSGELPYLIALSESDQPSARSVTFTCDRKELADLIRRLGDGNRPWRTLRSDDPGGGEGLEVELPEGEIFRFLADTQPAAPLEGRELPRQLTHVVLNSTDADASASFTERVLGFKVSDRTRGMLFVRCNSSHHSLAFARAGYASLNHVAFQMMDIDAVMRGIGRLRDAGHRPAWGPGRHGPGNNVFAYFIAPFGAVVEFSTATENVSDDYRAGSPEDWVWPPNRIDQWGVSDKDVAALAQAEQRFRFRREWRSALESREV